MYMEILFLNMGEIIFGIEIQKSAKRTSWVFRRIKDGANGSVLFLNQKSDGAR